MDTWMKLIVFMSLWTKCLFKTLSSYFDFFLILLRLTRVKLYRFYAVQFALTTFRCRGGRTFVVNNAPQELNSFYHEVAVTTRWSHFRVGYILDLTLPLSWSQYRIKLTSLFHSSVDFCLSNHSIWKLSKKIAWW